MKKILTIFAAVLLTSTAFSQTKKIPSAVLKTLEGQSVDAATLGGDGKIRVVSFWATWCSPCKKELDAISEIYEDWQHDYDVELVAISTDDARSAAKVPGVVNAKGWPYRILLDSNKELSRAANIQSVPYTFLLDKEGNIVFEHIGYAPGDEEELEEQIAKLAKK
ncbi:MAG: TlpA family protein disulfide reductase [Lewinellaceae bacterium]|nr:TlpA family protein disulfide reductase [Saprospiraceae bacterium]MCB9345022.1 TlpA family protein disulfide reductase [Lewinellaceae bacterium]